MSKEIVEAVHVLEREKGISAERLMAALEDALLSAYNKQPGATPYARVEMDRDSGDFIVYELLVPEELEEKLLAEVEAEEPTVDPETGEMREPEEPELDPEVLAQYSDQIDERDVTPENFGRIAAQTAKQVILQRIREAERDKVYDEFQDRVGELITGIVQQSDSRYTLVQLRERVEALLPKSEQVDGERYDHGQRVRAVIKEVSSSTREPGYRSKIAVVSHADGVDPVGACVGPRGSRVRMVVSELRGEKIDIVPYNQLSLAIGREGQNARLAARLTGWRIDIRSETEFAREEQEGDFEEEETSGRCAAIMSSGRRCPNASLPG